MPARYTFTKILYLAHIFPHHSRAVTLTCTQLFFPIADNSVPTTYRELGEAVRRRGIALFGIIFQVTTQLRIRSTCVLSLKLRISTGPV
jgi:hypothetical protein